MSNRITEPHFLGTDQVFFDVLVLATLGHTWPQLGTAKQMLTALEADAFGSLFDFCSSPRSYLVADEFCKFESSIGV